MSLIPLALQKVIDEIGNLPGVGPRTAERYALALLRAEPSVASELATALGELHAGVSYCQVTFALTEPGQTVSRLYDDPERDKQLVVVVEDPLDVISIEKTGEYRGTYHVLGGSLSPIDGVGPDKLRIKELLARIEGDKVKELILATNASVEGESTALFIQKLLTDKNHKLKLTRLARGIPVGVDLEYADQITLARALEHRQIM